MTIQLHHQTRLSIDLRASHGRAAPQSAPHAAPARSGWRRRRASAGDRRRTAPAGATAEQTLFATLVQLLSRYTLQTSAGPSSKALAVVIDVLTALLEQGSTPPSTPHDSRLIAQLVAVVERLAGRFPAAFLADLAAELREHLIAAGEIGIDTGPRHSADSGDEDDGEPDPER